MNAARGVVTATMVAALLACSGGEPSAGQIRKAVERMVERDFGHLSAGVKPVVHDVEKQSCESDGKGAYLCELTVDITAAGGQRLKMPLVSMLSKGDDGWVAGFDYPGDDQ